MKIKNNTTLSDYYKMADRFDIDNLFENGVFKAIDHVGIGVFNENTFGFVKDFQYLYSTKGLQFDEVAVLLIEHKIISKESLMNTNVFRVYETILYIKKSLDEINEIEHDKLSSSPKSDELMADIDRFAIFGAMLQYDSLSGGDVTKYPVIEKTPYNICFSKLHLEAERADFNEKLSNIRNRKYKNS